MYNCLVRSSYRNFGSEMKNSFGLVKSEFDNILPSMELILLVMDARVPDVLEETRRQRCLRITLQNALDSGKESDLLGMVNYALKKYLGILHCLEDGMVDLSNNACERQNLRITKYLLNNYKTSALGLLRA